MNKDLTLYLSEFVERYKLLPRHRDIMKVILNGDATNVQIGKALQISPFTVKNHLKLMYQKTESESKIALMVLYLNFVMGSLEKVAPKNNTNLSK